MKRLLQTILLIFISIATYAQGCKFWPVFDPVTYAAVIPFGNTCTVRVADVQKSYVQGPHPYSVISPSHYFTPDPGIATTAPPNSTPHNISDLGVFSFTITQELVGHIWFKEPTATGFYLHVSQIASAIIFNQSFTLISHDGDLDLVTNVELVPKDRILNASHLTPTSSPDDANATVFFPPGTREIRFFFFTHNVGDVFKMAFTFPDQCSFFVREPSDELKGDGEIINDPEKIVALISDNSLERKGVSADGLSKLLIIAPWEETLTFILSDLKGGRLSPLNRQDDLDLGARVSPVEVDGKKYVIAVYTAPDGFGRNPVMTSGGRDVEIRVSQNFSPVGTIPLKIHTPPVVLIHGMWSNQRVWLTGGFYQYLKSENFPFIIVPDYSFSNYTTFMPSSDPANYPAGVKSLYGLVPRALQAYVRTSGLATSRVDVVAHSLGGLMARSFMQTPGYAVNTNYFKGYLHKLVTIGTPHLGSNLGPLLWGNRNKPVQIPGALGPLTLGTIGSLLADAGMPVGSCHADFAPGSPAYLALANSNIKSHAIVGNWKPNQSFSYFQLDGLLELLYPNTDPDELHGEDNDLIVGITSQKGKLDGLVTSIFRSTIHSEIIAGSPTTETNSGAIHFRTLGLLLSDHPDEFAPAFPAPAQRSAGIAFSQNEVVDFSETLPDSTKGFIQITSPTRGTVLNADLPNQVIVEFQVTGSLIPASSLFIVKDVGFFAGPQSPPYKVSIEIPRHKIGKIPITALVRDSAGNFFADTSHILLKSSTGATNISVYPDRLAFDSLFNRQALSTFGTIIGAPGDTSIVDLTHTSTGTIYRSRKGNVGINDNGLVTAALTGSDIIDIIHNNTTISIPVDVLSICSVAKPDIRIARDTLISSSMSGNQWFINNTEIPGATDNFYVAKIAGRYSLQVTRRCTSPMSETVEVLPATDVTPVITCPQDIVVPSDLYKCQATVSFSATATGVPASSVVYRIGSTAITSPYNFPVGTTIVSATASNGAGDSATCTFKVMVLQGQTFSISIPDAAALNAGVEPNTVYTGYSPASSITLKAQVVGAGNNLTYKWSTGATTASIVVSPTLNTTYSVIVTDGLCVNTASKEIKVVDVRCGNALNKVTVCKVPPGNPSNANEVCIAANAVAAQLATGSYLGPCRINNITMPSQMVIDESPTEIKPGLHVTPVPNPSNQHFVLNIQSDDFVNKINITVRDVVGRVKEAYSLLPNGSLKIGADYPPGIYYVQFVQNNRRVAVKLIKLAR